MANVSGHLTPLAGPAPTDLARDGGPSGWTDEDLRHSIGARFQRTVASSPSRVAIRTPKLRLTYAELGHEVNQLARALRDGHPGDEPVALLLEGVPSIRGLYGAFTAGRIAVPLDPRAPTERLQAFVRDAGPGVVVTQAAMAERAGSLLPAGGKLLLLEELGGVDGDPIDLEVDAEAPASILYTSGSTGDPKGVVFTHRAVLFATRCHTEGNRMTPEDRSLMLGFVGVGQAVSVVHPALLNGGSLYPFDLDAEGPVALARWMKEAGITVFSAGPALLRTLVPSIVTGPQLPDVRLVKTGGDTVLASDLHLFGRHLGETGRLIRIVYATTEAGPVTAAYLDATAALAARDPVSAGRPYPGIEVVILDEDRRPLPAGAAGQIAVRSPSLMRTYWRREEQTRERVIVGADGTRTYLTGDLGRLLPDGSLVHLGRKDLLVKVRGVRVELGEVEAALRAVDGVREAAALAEELPGGEKRIVGHVVPDDPAPTPAALRRAMRARLPEAMVPAAFVLHERFPTNARGKVDRPALAASPARLPSPAPEAPVPPRDDLERLVARVFGEVLGREVTDVGTDFFENGGTSLLAVTLALGIAEATGRHVPLATLVEAPTVEELARSLRRPRSFSPLVALQPRGRRLPFFCVHPMGGQVLIFRDLARRLGEEQPFYGLQRERSEDGASVHHDVGVMADQYLAAIREVQPTGPYRLGGRSIGALIAYEMARRLVTCGETVSTLALFDPRLARGKDMSRPPRKRGLERLSWGLRFHGAALRALAPSERTRYVGELSSRLLGRLSGRKRSDPGQEEERLPGIVHRVDPFTPEAYPGHATLFLSRLQPGDMHGAEDYWRSLVRGGLAVHVVPGAHSFIVKEPFVREVVRWLGLELAR